MFFTAKIKPIAVVVKSVTALKWAEPAYVKLGFFLSTSAQPFRCISYNPQDQIGCRKRHNSLYENRKFWNFTFTALHNTAKFIDINPTAEIRR